VLIRHLKIYYLINKFIVLHKKRFPLLLWNLCYNPLWKLLREHCPSEEIEKQSVKIDLKKYAQVDPNLGLWKKNNYVLQIQDPKSLIFKIQNCVLNNSGIIITDNCIHKASSLYRRLSIASVSEIFSKKNTPQTIIKKATLISRQFVDQGTYGDYMTEFLIPLLFQKENISGNVLIDADYIQKYCESDLNKLEILSMRIPPEGLFVEELTVIGPVNIFDNFHPKSVDNLVKYYPLSEKYNNEIILNKKVYLSRKGLKSANPKQHRFIENEDELISFLRNKGYSIIYPHLKSNDSIRKILSEAKTVIFSTGSSFFNLAWSNPHKVIEIANNNMWSPSAVRFGFALGLKNYRIISTLKNVISLEQVESAISE